MTSVLWTSKLKLLNLNEVKQQLFSEIKMENPHLVSQLVALPVRNCQLMTKANVAMSLKSVQANQVIWYTILFKGCKFKQHKHLPVKINSRDWKRQKASDTYRISFPKLLGMKQVLGRVASCYWQHSSRTEPCQKDREQTGASPQCQKWEAR